MRIALLALWLAGFAAGQEPVPLPQAHAHNDYLHARPLFDALDHGFCSVEADVWLVEGELLVAHDREDCRPERTLRALYLEPLAARVRDHGGRVHRGGPLEFQLLIDFKSGGAETWTAVRAELRRHRDLFTHFGPDGRTPGAVLAILSGQTPDELVLAEAERLCACDGWFDDLDDGSTSDQHPLLSASWREHFEWNGQGPFPDAQHRELRTLVRRAHDAGRRIRFWAVPDRQVIWRAQLEAGVDWLNLDDLPGARRFLLDRRDELALRRELDAWLDSRFVEPDPTPALAASLVERGVDAARLEELLRKGPVDVDDPGLEPGTLHAGLPLQCDHVDYATEHFLYLPKGFDPAVPHPLVLIGHGGNGAMSADYARRACGAGIGVWIGTADRFGLILAAPLTERGWGAIGNSILLSLLSKLQRQYRIDPDRVFVTGHSMGGHLTWRSALSMPDRWAAVSPMSGGYDYVERGQMPLLWNVPGYATFGEREPYEIDTFNRRMRTWLDQRGYDWRIVEKNGGHAIYADELPKVAEFFAARRRDPHRPVVWAQGGKTQSWRTAGRNQRWGLEHTWNAARPIPRGVFHWLRLLDAPELEAPNAQRVLGVADLERNRIELTAEHVRRVRLHLHPRLIDFDRPLTVVANGEVAFEGEVEPDLGAMLALVREFDDRGRIAWATLEVAIDGDRTPDPPSR